MCGDQVSVQQQPLKSSQFIRKLGSSPGQAQASSPINPFLSADF